MADETDQERRRDRDVWRGMWREQRLFISLASHVS